MRTFPTAQDIQQFIERASSGQFTAQDLDAFYQKPQLWCLPTAVPLPNPEDAQGFWQSVWDGLALEIGGRIIVPPMPRLTDKQHRSIARYRLLPVYLPKLREERYPPCFKKLYWTESLASKVQGMPLKGQWVAIETVKKSEWNDEIGYPNDRLATVLKFKRLDVSLKYLRTSLLKQVAKATGYPARGVRLPTIEEWNFVANFFNWLKTHRDLDLPNLGSTESAEWCLNGDTPLITGQSSEGGLAYAGLAWRDSGFGFRLLFEL